MGKRVQTNLPRSHITRIESRAGLGIPDMLIALHPEGLFVMLELKVVQKGKKVNLSPHQISFLIKHSTLGAPVFVLVQHKILGERENYLSLYKGESAIELFERGIDAPFLLRCKCPNADWEGIRKMLLTS